MKIDEAITVLAPFQAHGARIALVIKELEDTILSESHLYDEKLPPHLHNLMHARVSCDHHLRSVGSPPFDLVVANAEAAKAAEIASTAEIVSV